MEARRGETAIAGSMHDSPAARGDALSPEGSTIRARPQRRTAAPRKARPIGVWPGTDGRMPAAPGVGVRQAWQTTGLPDAIFLDKR